MDRARRSPLRILAPVGLVAFAFAFLLVVTTADVSDGGDSSDGKDRAEQRDLEGGDRRERRRERREERAGEEDVYLVKEGDTLATIAETTDKSVEELQELNPNLDPQALVTGQCILLRDGAECPSGSGEGSESVQ